ncbi:MAG: hypothetical protein [Wendovervirus sonii]|uniref:BspA family leucine-rich repeat surface protein n=1 Tax=phage Lak_Megaphage_Sonny TaxID=3109229 RepID=A0ABZ0Z464_9CAUD|nr:MAG: hypothetical protein [phage Lak_Megaphage_Sonny]
MKHLYKKIYEAINTGIQNALALNDEDVSIIYQHKKIHNDFDSNEFVYKLMQDEYKKLLAKKNFIGCLDLYNSEYLHFEKRAIGYKVNSKEELRELVKNFNDKKWDNFDLNWIDVSEITDMSKLFYDLSDFNCNISEWDVSNVTNMHRMFSCCEKFNSNLSKWNVSNVTNMHCMFYFCNKFNSDLSKWDVSKVKDISFMFYACYAFNYDLSKWNISKVKDMEYMFYWCPIKEEYKPKFNK